MLKINQQLQKINDTSLAKIIFYKNQTDIANVDFYNIVFAANGVFVVLENDFGVSFNKIVNIKYVNAQLDSLTDELYSYVPKPPLSLFVQILEMFKYMNNEIKSELCVNVYYSKETKDFHLSIEDQFVNSATSNYEYNENYEMSKDYIRYLQIHSHNSMAANFSARDNKDENYTALCYYGVVGKINSESQFYNVESTFRIWNGVRFVNIGLGDVFELGTSQVEIEDKFITKMDQIIEFSKKTELEKKAKLLPIKNILEEHDFYPGGFNPNINNFKEFNELLGTLE